MTDFFFSGSHDTKVDDKGRFVLPQSMRYGLIEKGKLEFTLALGLGGSLAIYRRSDIDRIVQRFKEKEHVGKYQKFLTLFFSTMHHTTCDKLGRVSVPSLLKKAAGLDGEIVIAGVLNKIEIWPKKKYEEQLLALLEQSDEGLNQMMEEAFSFIDEKEEEPKLTKEDQLAYEEL